MSQESVQARAIFIDAVENVSPERWREYLDEACGDDAALRDKVQRLLDAHGAIGSFMDKPAAARVATVDQPITEKPGTQIGPYKLLQQIGEGGMGVVYMAEQKEPVKRRVALKIIKPGMDTRQVIARFEAERQALAMMDHPNIAKVLDAGATGSGRPYFVMELVNGLPVTEYCDAQHMTPKERLQLFVPICQAVQHAHQKGIIHRDIKPSNILVAVYDGQPVPKVIDFGVAKATNQSLTEKTMFTQLGQVVGTLDYMAPEQAERNQLDIDTRSDVYSLGVVLYELLTGETPFDRERLRSAALDEMLRIIREEEPSKPSTKVSSSQSLPSIAANRRIEPAKLGSMIRGELDWIVLKAMEKDRGRRYETASKFAEDVQHYLNDEAVLACPPSRAYKFRKFTRRNKATICATAAVAVSLIVGSGLVIWQAIKADEERDRAVIAEGVAEERLSIVESQKKRIEEEKQRVAAEAERANNEASRANAEASKAKTEAAIAEAVYDFLNQDLLGMSAASAQAKANLSPNPNIKLRTVLDSASVSIQGRFSEQPLVEAAIAHTLGHSYLSIGAYDEAEQHTRRAFELRQQHLGGEQSATLESMYNLAIVYHNQGRWEEAERLILETLAIRQQTLGGEHPDTLHSMNTLANVHSAQGQYEKARQLHRETLAARRRTLGQEHPNTLDSLHNLASVWLNIGRHQEAEKLNRETLTIRRQTLGGEHPDTLRSMNNLALVYQGQGRYADAELLHRKTLESRRRTLGHEHPDTLSSMNNLALLYQDQGRYGEAERAYQETLAIQRRTLGKLHPHTLSSILNLATLYQNQTRYDEAERLFQETLEIQRRMLGDEHPLTLKTAYALALVYQDQGRYLDAERLHQKTLRPQSQTLGNEHPDTLRSMYALAFLYQNQGRYAEAERIYQETLEIQRRTLGDEHSDTLRNMHNLALVYASQARFEEAKRLLQDTLPLMRTVLGEKHPETVQLMYSLALVYDHQGILNEAEKLLRHVVEIAPGHASAHSAFGKTLLRQGRLNEAISEWRRALEIDPRNACATSFVWQIVRSPDRSQAEYEEALEIAKRQVKQAPESGQALRNLGIAQYRNQQWETVIKSLSQDFGKMENAPESGVVLAMAYWMRGERLKAEELLEHAITLMVLRDMGPEHQMLRAEAEQLLGFELSDADRQELAVQYASRELKQDPDDKRMLKWRADVYIDLEDWPAAANDLSRLVELKPKHPQSHAILARVYRKLKEYDRAIEACNTALELDPDFAAAYFQRGDAYFKQKKYSAALADLGKSIELNPDFSWSYSSRGELYAVRGEWQQALDDFREFHRRDPVNREVKYKLALLLIATGDRDGYRRWCQDLMLQYKEKPESATRRSLLESALLHPDGLEDYSRLIDLAEANLAEHPKSATALILVGAARLRAGHTEAALAQLEALVGPNSKMMLKKSWLALARIHAGQFEKARELLDIVDEWLAHSPDIYWGTRFQNKLLRHEAERLMNESEKP